MYYLTNWKETAPGQKEADLPANTGYMVLASPGYEAIFSLLECELESDDASTSVGEVSYEMFEIIESAKHFPPSLALARDEVEEVFESRDVLAVSRVEFLQAYKTILERYLKNQPRSNYFMCRAADTETGYIYKDGFYWVIDYSPGGREVSWVSRDFHVYKNHISFFHVEEKELLNIFSKKS